MAENDYANPVLVTTDWLADHLSDDKVVIAEVDEDPDVYDEGHIRGAIKLHWRDDLEDPVERDLVDKPTFERLMSERGVSNDSTIVLYGDKNNWFAAYAYWYLKIYGHEDVRILDGGRTKWTDEGRELTTDLPERKRSEYKAAERDESIPWAQAVRDDGTFKTADELRELYEGKGITPEKEVTAYCRIGERSAHTWFVLHELLGYETVKNYDGSWTEWGNLVDVPIEKGA